MHEPHWDETASHRLIEYGEVFVPRRDEQAHVINLVLDLGEQPRQVWDLACGDGRLSAAILDHYHNATVLGLDGSPAMLERTRSELAHFGERFRATHFDLDDSQWRQPDGNIDAIVSSLAIHHVRSNGKQQLFNDIHAMLAPGGRCVIADIVQPSGVAGYQLAEQMWDESVKAQSLEKFGDLSAYDAFHAEHSSDDRPKPLAMADPLTLQLDRLRAAGFVEVDVYWMHAAHAVYGGRRAKRQ